MTTNVMFTHRSEPNGNASPNPDMLTPPHIPDHELLRRIGGGSYGEVWLARNAMGTLRAVKVVYRASFEQDKPYEREFAGIQKFEPISRDHEGHVDILHVGRNREEGYFYYVMELADPAQAADEQVRKREGTKGTSNSDPGFYVPRTLKGELQRRGRLPVQECVSIGLALTRAVAHLHQHGLVHRDIKPANIIFANGAPKLADIGLVTGIDATRSFVGTIGFIPPEGPGTPQADLYSLGKVLYEIGTGKDREDFPQLPADLRHSPDANALVELNEVLLKACHKDVHERYGSAEAMLADLELLQRGKSVQNQRKRQRHWMLARAISIAMAFMGLLIAVTWLLWPKSISIAVLPFDIKTDATNSFLGESLSDDLMRALGRITRITVRARESSFAPQQKNESLANLGSRLKVDILLTGSITNINDRLEIRARLINVQKAAQFWTKSYSGSMVDLPSIERTIAQDLASILKGTLNDQQRQQIGPVTENAEAYLLYLQGSYFLYRWSDIYIDSAIDLLKQAAKLDPGSAAIHARLAQAYVQKAFSVDPQRELQAEAAAEIQRARDADPNCAEAFLALGKSLWSPWNNFNHESAVEQFRRARDLDPNLAEAYHQLAIVYVHVGLFDKARQASRKAVQLDPLNPGALLREGVANLYGGHYAQALAVFERIPDSHQTALVVMHKATTWFYLGRTNEARSRLEQFLVEKPGDPVSRSMLAVVLAARGENNKAEHEISLAEAQEKKYLGHYHHASYNIGSAYALMKNTGAALKWLRKAVIDGYPCYPRFKQDPNLDNLRSDREFKAFMNDLQKQFERYNTL
jgi:serine/threonine protein kinase